MAYSNQTTHYGLPLPVGSDKSSWLDNNTAFAAIDTAIYQASTDAGAAAGDIAQLQNDVTSLQSGKQDVLTWDASPTNGSLNAVRSGGVYTAIDNVSIALGVTDLKVSTLEGAMGNTDISAIGDGTVTGAISSLAQSGGESVSVNYTGSETFGTIISRLYAAIDVTKIKHNSAIVIDNVVYNISALDNLFFVVPTLTGTYAGSTVIRIAESKIFTWNGSYTEITSQTVASGNAGVAYMYY